MLLIAQIASELVAVGEVWGADGKIQFPPDVGNE